MLFNISAIIAGLYLTIVVASTSYELFRSYVEGNFDGLLGKHYQTYISNFQ